MTAENSIPPGQALCVSCGLCCMGVWFSQALMTRDEIEGTRNLGLKVLDTDPESDEIAFSLPCPKHIDGKCSVYGSWRPSVCGDYHCKLLREVNEGTMELDQAMSLVRLAKGLALEVLEETGPIEGGLVGDRFLQIAEDTAALSPGARLSAGALRVIYLRHYEHPVKESDTPAQSAGAAPKPASHPE